METNRVALLPLHLGDPGDFGGLVNLFGNERSAYTMKVWMELSAGLASKLVPSPVLRQVRQQSSDPAYFLSYHWTLLK
jgi:hypothetical protein